ncbi:hypothetical protein JXA40_07065 [bacterium]|nr:hypothetical protein [candidate division CSSED10-310 bacterium]
MALNEELRTFVKEALARGLSRVEVRSALAEAGWPEDQIRNALNAFAQLDFPVPVPRPQPYVSAREAFLYLIMFTTLTIAATNLGNLIFHFIDRAFPDPTDPAVVGSWVTERLRWAAAYIIISFPIFLTVSIRINRAIARDPVKRSSKIRKWLTYVMLFIAAGFVIGDLTSLVFNLLGGEMTLRFTLKVLTVGVIAGSVFGYYFWDLRQDERITE